MNVAETHFCHLYVVIHQPTATLLSQGARACYIYNT